MQQWVCPGEHGRCDEKQSGDASISQLLGGRGLDFPQLKLVSSNGIVSLAVEKQSKVTTPESRKVGADLLQHGSFQRSPDCCCEVAGTCF